MTAFPGQTLTQTMLGQLWAALSRLVVIQPGIEPGSVVKPLALRCSALDCCATQKPFDSFMVMTEVELVEWYQIHGVFSELFYCCFIILLFYLFEINNHMFISRDI